MESKKIQQEEYAEASYTKYLDDIWLGCEEQVPITQWFKLDVMCNNNKLQCFLSALRIVDANGAVTLDNFSENRDLALREPFFSKIMNCNLRTEEGNDQKCNTLKSFMKCIVPL